MLIVIVGDENFANLEVSSIEDFKEKYRELQYFNPPHFTKKKEKENVYYLLNRKKSNLSELETDTILKVCLRKKMALIEKMLEGNAERMCVNMGSQSVLN